MGKGSPKGGELHEAPTRAEIWGILMKDLPLLEANLNKSPKGNVRLIEDYTFNRTSLNSPTKLKKFPHGAVETGNFLKGTR